MWFFHLAPQEAVYQMDQSQRQEHSCVWAGLMCPISSRSTIIIGPGSDPQGSEVCHPGTDSTVTLQKVLDNKSSQLILCLWLCSVPYDDGWNYSTEPPQSSFQCSLTSYGSTHRLMQKLHIKLYSNSILKKNTNTSFSNIFVFYLFVLFLFIIQLTKAKKGF